MTQSNDDAELPAAGPRPVAGGVFALLSPHR
jgi:hypothetical protein